jgi:hypothetical protein
MTDKIKNDRDLIVIFSKIYLYIKRYYIILLLFAGMGIGYGWYKNHTAGYYFKKHLVLSSILVEKYISSDVVYSLQTLVADNNINALAEKLNIPKNAAASIIKIDTSTYHYKENVGFMVDLSFRDSIFADTITSGLLYFLNNNEYYRRNTQLFIQEKQKLLKSLNIRLKLADSLRNGSNSLYSTSQGENAIFVRSSSSEQIRLMDEKYRIEKDIEFGSKISLVNQSMGRVFEGIGLTKLLILYGFGFSILGILISLFIESLRLTRKYIKEQVK